MSTPTHDPLTVTTRDGATWVRRAVTREGQGLYALEGVCECPAYVLASLADLAQYGVRSADPVAEVVAKVGALPVPLGHGFPSREDQYESPLHHDYAIPHDLPEVRP